VTVPPQLPDPRQLARYFALAQVGFEMVVPIGLGWWLDDIFGSTPWLTVVGVILGLSLGIWHLVVLGNRQDETPPPGDKRP
jgi:F0F1-type ATP synthase assembly protein I